MSSPSIVRAVYWCTGRCGQVLLIVGDASEDAFLSDYATKVEGHVCEPESE